MDFIGIENITPYKNEVGYSIYKYDDEINIGDKDNFVCSIRVVILEVQDSLSNRLGKKVQALSIVEDYGQIDNIDDFETKLKKYIIEEVLFVDLNKENIDVIYTKQ